MVFIFFLTIVAAAFAQPLSVKVSGMKEIKGQILYLVFNRGRGFPDEAKKSVLQGKARVEDKTVVIDLNLTPGRYAVSLFHDENENGRLDTNFLGIPKEPFAFSNDPTILFGAPTFKDCVLELSRGSPLDLRLRSF